MPHQIHSGKQYLLPIALLLAIIIVLLATAILLLTPKIQNDLAQQIQEELTKHSIAAKITLSGRDVMLTGMVDDVETKQKAESITKKVCGIRFVENQLLTEKAENLALLNTNKKPATEHSTETQFEPEITTSSILNSENLDKSVAKDTSSPSPSQSKETSSKEEDNTKTSSPSLNSEKDAKIASSEQLKAPHENTESTKQVNKKVTPKIEGEIKTEESSAEATTKQTVEEDTSQKSKVLNYETMLAAMNAYKKQKGRNSNRLNTAAIQFKKNSDEMLPATQTLLNNWISHFQKNKASIEISVTAKTESLALNRAKVISTYFINQNIEEDRIKALGKSGEETVSIEIVK